MGSDLFAILFSLYYLVYSPPIQGVCPPDMVYVPTGLMAFGSNIDNQSPMRRFETDAYCIDTYEYPNIKGEFATVNVDWQEAEQLCEDLGKRLCTEREWEKACRGPKHYWYTYGKRYLKNKCATSMPQLRTIFPTGHFPDCKSGYGVHDMSGGMYEWTADPYAPYPGNTTMKKSRFARWEKSIRSAGYSKGKESYCTNRSAMKWNKKRGYLSFRCCTSFDETENKRVKDNIWDDINSY